MYLLTNQNVQYHTIGENHNVQQDKLSILISWACILEARFLYYIKHTQCWPGVRDILFWGHKSIFVVVVVAAGIILCVLGNIKWFCMVIQGNFLVLSKYAEFGIVISSCTAAPG